MNTNKNKFLNDLIKHFDTIWQESEKIPGYITKNEGLILYLNANIVSNIGDIIELGPYQGRSSVILGKGLSENKSLYKLVSIDNFAKRLSSTYNNSDDPQISLLNNINLFGLNDYFRLIKKDSVEAFSEFESNSAGLIFIDSEHTANQLEKEFPKAMRIINPKGKIIIHDYQNSAVETAYSTWISKNIIPFHETIFVKDSTPNYRGNGLLIVNPNKE